MLTKQGPITSLFTRSALLLAVTSLPVMSGCAEMEEGDEERSGLLFDLDEVSLMEIHDTFLGDEDIELTRARLTAPFECSLYDDFCDLVGRDAALSITEAQVAMALSGATEEEIEEAFDAEVDSAMELVAEEPEEESEEASYRSNGGWTTHTIGSYRLRVRNGITTPLIGKRSAWTQSKFQKNGWFGWTSKQADSLCADTGRNTQELYTWGGGVPSSTVTLESINPGNWCSSNDGNYKKETKHDRNNGWSGWGLGNAYIITADGCGSASNNGSNFSACPASHEMWF